MPKFIPRLGLADNRAVRAIICIKIKNKTFFYVALRCVDTKKSRARHNEQNENAQNEQFHFYSHKNETIKAIIVFSLNAFLIDFSSSFSVGDFPCQKRHDTHSSRLMWISESYSRLERQKGTCTHKKWENCFVNLSHIRIIIIIIICRRVNLWWEKKGKKKLFNLFLNFSLGFLWLNYTRSPRFCLVFCIIVSLCYWWWSSEKPLYLMHYTHSLGRNMCSGNLCLCNIETWTRMSVVRRQLY